MWIIMAASLVFMGIMVGMVYFDHYRNSKSPLHKIQYVGTIARHDLVPLTTAQKKKVDHGEHVTRFLDKIQIGVAIRNLAPFPISIIFENGDTSIENKKDNDNKAKKPPRATYPKAAIILVQGNMLHITDEAIEMGGMACQKLDGNMKIKIKYGFLGKEKYILDFDAKVEIMMQTNGFQAGVYTSWDSPQIGVNNANT